VSRAIPEGPGADMRHPMIMEPGDLDLTALRKHIAEHHSHARTRGGLPRRNADLAAWHWREHYRYHTSHVHGGPQVKVRRPSNPRMVAQMARPLGWYTGQWARTRADLDRQFRERHAGPPAEAHPARQPCGCPVDAQCTGYHQDAS